jgi:hypothetical protein
LQLRLTDGSLLAGTILNRIKALCGGGGIGDDLIKGIAIACTIGCLIILLYLLLLFHFFN